MSIARGKLYSLNSLGMAFEGTHQEALITPHALRMASGKHLPSLQRPSFLRFFDILVYLSLSFFFLPQSMILAYHGLTLHS